MPCSPRRVFGEVQTLLFNLLTQLFSCTKTLSQMPQRKYMSFSIACTNNLYCLGHQVKTVAEAGDGSRFIFRCKHVGENSDVFPRILPPLAYTTTRDTRPSGLGVTVNLPLYAAELPKEKAVFACNQAS